MNDGKLLYTVPEAAARLSLSRAKLYELIKSGSLDSVRIDGSRRIKGQALHSFVEGLGRAA
jgi:excisionase family DNA binding protein